MKDSQEAIHCIILLIHGGFSLIMIVLSVCFCRGAWPKKKEDRFQFKFTRVSRLVSIVSEAREKFTGSYSFWFLIEACQVWSGAKYSSSSFHPVAPFGLCRPPFTNLSFSNLNSDSKNMISTLIVFIKTFIQKVNHKLIHV